MKNINNMTLREKIGQLFVIGFDGDQYNDHLEEVIEKYKVGNIILFSRNITNLEQLYDLNKKLYQEITKATGIIPFMTIDQEGGMVTRLLDEATFFPGNMTVAATNLNNAYKIGQMMGEQLLHLGLNFNLAPVLDVNNNPLNPVIGVRSYSDDPKVVSDFGVNYIKGLQSTKVLATAKHFPGHGDTSTDSHYSMTVVPHNTKRLKEVELVPFIEAINNDVAAIMSAHVLFPAIEPDNVPGTISGKVLTDLLREELGFRGLIISDCMEMKAIDDYYTTEKAALMGLMAGLDLITISHTLEKQVAAINIIEEAVLSGRVPLSLIDQKVARILKFKESLLPVVTKFFLEKEFIDVKDLLVNQEDKQVVSKMVDDSLTLVKGNPFKEKGKVLLIATEPFVTTIAEDQFSQRSIIDRVKLDLPLYDTIKIPVNPDNDLIATITNQAVNYDQIVVCTYNANVNLGQCELVFKLNLLEKDLHVISTRNPYDFLKLSYVNNFVALYEYTPNSVNTIVRYLKGDISPKGKLPVNLTLTPEIGASIYVGLEDYPLEENIKYLQLLSTYGIKKVFISAHIPEMNSDFEKELNTILEHASSLGMQVILDVSKSYFEKLDLKHNIYSLRLDFGFSNDDILELYKKSPYIIELNASTVTKKQLEYLQNHGLDLSKVRISYNFYPKPYTGMSYEDLINRNQMFKRYGLKTMAYIPSINKRPPLYEGLPTLESHRNGYLETNLMELYLIGIDEIVFGDSFVSEEELKIATDFEFNMPLVPIIINKDISLLERDIICRIHRTRIDESDYFKRSLGRVKEGSIKPLNTIARKKGYVTIDNSEFLRYQGELAIVKQDLPADKRSNVVGRVVCSDFLLDNIKPGTKFKFVIKGEE